MPSGNSAKLQRVPSLQHVSSVGNYTAAGINIGINGQSTFGTNAVGVLGMASGTAPTTSPADAAQLWVADRGATAGKAGLHGRSEDGTVWVMSDRFGFGTATPGYNFEFDDTIGTSKFGISGQAGGYPHIYMGGSSGTVAAVFERITAAASIYFGEDADTGGYNYRGAGTFVVSGAKTGTDKVVAIHNSATNATVNTAYLSLNPTFNHGGYTGPYIKAYNVISTDNCGLAFGVYNGSLSEVLRITHDGLFGLKNTAPATLLDQTQWSADALGSYHTFSKSRHATPGSHTIVVDNDVIGGLKFAPSDGTDFGTISAQIRAEVDDAAPGASSIGGMFVWSVAAGAGADDLTDHLWLDHSGRFGLGVSPLTNMASGDMVLEGGSLVLKEITTPTADADYGKVYTKNDNKLYFQDGAGVEHEIAFV